MGEGRGCWCFGEDEDGVEGVVSIYVLSRCQILKILYMDTR